MTTQEMPVPWRVVRTDDRPGCAAVAVSAYTTRQDAEEVAAALNGLGERRDYKVMAQNPRSPNVLTPTSDSCPAPTPADTPAAAWRVVRVDARMIGHPVAVYAAREDADAVARALNEVERGMDYYEVVR